MTDKNSILRLLPSVDVLLHTDVAQALRNHVGTTQLTSLARATINELRSELQELDGHTALVDGPDNNLRERLLVAAATRLERIARMKNAASLCRVINATGVILHTNLGRAPLSETARRHLADEAARYCTLEYDLATGARGRRGARVEELLTELTGAEAALVVNNCAAATLLTLAALAHDGETIISRGELVEIGGDFRVPDVMRQSGTRMVEIGTTNRTRIDDYQRAINPQTRLLLRVHPSNYRIIGFTHAPTISELVELAKATNLPLYEDAGSGALYDFQPYGLEGEPVVPHSIASGVDVVSFSGDKLLGATQAGLIVGRAEIINRLRKHPLYRALRADKLGLAALEATMEAHLRGAAFIEVPTLRMLAQTAADIEHRARNFINQFNSHSANPSLQCTLADGQSAVGGGSAPVAHLVTRLIALTHNNLSADKLEQALRDARPPVIARISNERVVLDLRTVIEDEEADLLAVLATL